MNRKKFVAGNWKMNTDVRETAALIAGIRRLMPAPPAGADVAVCPPFTSLESAEKALRGSGIALGAQDMSRNDDGAFTGEVSARMLLALGCRYVILGHSERRQYFGETNEIIDKKIKAALKNNLKPIFCVGETLEENEAGQTREVLGRQLIASSDRFYFLSGCVIAYEPIWAIGTGKSASGDDANKTIGFIRQFIARQHGNGIANTVRILYGGSVNATNIAEFMRKSDIDGALVGGASLKADDFVSIVKQASEIKGV
jgi:triosephosphate isomerase